jgi:ribosomal protein S12 methylthiotransferase accessory factor
MRLPSRSVERALGVTRVARVTGLDRTGVEVACAVRPGGHVLQVTNGKGWTGAEAARGALLEAAELACAERVDPLRLRWASERELSARGVPFLGPAALGGRAARDARLAWRDAVDLFSARPLLVPAAAVHVSSERGPALGLAGVRWTSNGMGAHPSRPAALLHALLEAVERHDLALALPGGWTEEAVAARLLPLAVVGRGAPRAATLARRVERRGFAVHLFDLTPSRAVRGGRPVGLPVAGALLLDRERGPVPLTAGYACRVRPAAALEAALLEAAQSRLTDIHGAREDVAPADPDGVERLWRALSESHGKSPFLSPAGGEGPGQGVRPSGGSRDAAVPRSLRLVLARLRAAGFSRGAAVDLAPPELGLHVVKVLVPGLRVSELLG